jgi:protoporphyrinogen oxidase
MNNHNEKIFILGGGISGLAAASILKNKAILFEKNESVGGLCQSIHKNNIIFDKGTHIFFTIDEKMIRILNETLNSELYLRDAEAWNYDKQIFFPHPVQVNSYYLPVDLKIECITSYVKNLLERDRNKEIHNYKEWSYHNFGEGFSNHFLLRYAQKFWTVSPETLTIDWISNRILNPDIESVILGSYKKNIKNENYISKFRYPKQGGFGRFINIFSEQLLNIKVNQEVTSIEPENKKLVINNKDTIIYDKLLSSIPLPEYLNLCKNLPSKIVENLKNLSWTSVLVINLALKQSLNTNKHWEYYYEEDIPFFRSSFPANLSPANVPHGKGAICLEVAYNGRNNIDIQKVLARSIDSLIKIGYIKSNNDVLLEDTYNIKYGYVIFDFQRNSALLEIINYLKEFDIIPFGRYGTWDYLWSDQSYFNGIETAKNVLSSKSE